MQTVKFCLLVLLASAVVHDYPCAQGRSIQRILAKKPKGTVKTLKGDKGDIIDCVDMYMQPAFNHPLLKNHTLQTTPSLHKYGAQRNNPVLDSLFDISWRKNGGCPKGSVPIVRSVFSDRPIIRKNMSFSDLASYNQGHQYAVIFFNYGQASMQGGRATISQWDPHLAQPADFSLSQIWISGGQSGTTNLQTIEAGWQISSRWTPCTESDDPNLEICVVHKSHASRRYVGKEVRAEERDKRENNGGALIVGLQSEEEDLHGEHNMRDVWEAPISLLRREKRRLKKIKSAPIVHTVDSVDVSNAGCETEGDWPIMKQAHMSTVDQAKVYNGPLSQHRKTAQDMTKGGNGSSKSSPVAPQNKQRLKKTQRQVRTIKSLKPCLMTMRRK
ncbi:hypothetical protein Ancab_029622 [Ancistrocladus abbreviatus]